MNIEKFIENLAVQIYEEPLVHVREEANFPNICNPLHVFILLIDCDLEIDMNGVLGYLENPSGRHLKKTIKALEEIGAPKCSALFDSIQECMDRHDVSWNRLRSDSENLTEFEITSFRKLHGDSLDSFANEVFELSSGFSLFNTLYSPEDANSAFVAYISGKINELKIEIEKRIA
ncbi:MAG: DUF4375 domain-containing protein [Geobacteraceae bacterium]|nr:DUF4375 domain-containing protein [Geobacteraceae bacterium]